MERIGPYMQLEEFTTESAGTCEWCKAEKDGKLYFIKKFHTPVYPSNEVDLPEKKLQARKRRFHMALDAKKQLYAALEAQNTSRTLVVPVDVLNYQFHIVTVADYVQGNLDPSQVCKLSPWQRLVLMRLLTASLMSIHRAGVVHSDMKPDNILIIQDEAGNCTLKIIDFDGSFMADNPPETDDDVVGDPAYYAPEAYMMSQMPIRLDHRIDLFALGIILHYFWCGALPDKPSNMTIGECLLKHGRVVLNPAVPLPLQRMIAGLLNPNPDKRLSAEAAYEILGAQLSLCERKIVKLEPLDKEIKRKSETPARTASVQVECRTGLGDLIRSKTVNVPFGTTRRVYAESIPGYKLADSMASRTITVDTKGHTNSPIVFRYRKAIDSAEGGDTATVALPTRKRGWIVALVLTLVLITGLIIYFATRNNQRNTQQSTARIGYSTGYNDSSELTIRTSYKDSVQVNINKRGDRKIIRFTPTLSGTYRIYSSSNHDTKGWLYNSKNLYDRNLITSDDDSGTNNNFRMTCYNLVAYQDYYLVVSMYDSQTTGSFTVYVERE